MMPDLYHLPTERPLPAHRYAAARRQLSEVPSMKPWRLLGRWRNTGIVIGLGVGLSVGGGVALANGFFSQRLPGTPSDAQLSHTVSVTRTGTATVDLGPAPREANAVSLTLTGLSVGTFRFPDGSSLGCSQSDLSHPGPFGCQAVAVVPLRSGQHTVTITTSANASWKLLAAYINRVITAWKTNAHGQTYGVPNKHGFPDLVAVVFDRGRRSGYVKSTDFLCPTAVNGENFAIPVYTSNGTTKIGTFIVGPQGPGIRTVPVSSLNCPKVGAFGG